MDLSALARHGRAALFFSGGKDSLALAHLLRQFAANIAIYHVDTGDLLPEIRASVERVKAWWPGPFYHLHTNVGAWIEANGLPTDLLPYGAHPIGRAAGMPGGGVAARFDCCYANLMRPGYERAKADGFRLFIRGSKAVDTAAMPTRDGQVIDGVEIMLPIQGWTNPQVFAYLRALNVEVPAIYDHMENAPECARCSAWWSEGRAAYLKRFHPALWGDYAARLMAVAKTIEGPLVHLRRELEGCDNIDAPHFPLEKLNEVTSIGEGMGIKIMQGNRFGETDLEHVSALMAMMRPLESSHILDIGCGNGEMARLMHLRRPDLSFTLLNRSAMQLRGAPAGAAFRHILGDMHAIPMPDAAVDLAMFNYALCHGDIGRALREAARVTRLGGGLFIYDYERLTGDNEVMEARLAARAYTREVLLGAARRAGWAPQMGCAPGGDDILFRRLFANDNEYDAIFRHLRPVIWRMERIA